MINKLKKILAALKVQSKAPTFATDKRIVEAFVLDGITYYTFDDIFNIPVERAFSAIDHYNEMQQRCTRDYLISHLDAQNEILSSKKIDITKLAQLNLNLKERLEMIFDADLLYKLASVVYFDSSESPYKYDYKYGIEKIRRFKKADVDAFFLKTPIRNYLPFKDISADDLRTYIAVGNQVNLVHLKTLSQSLSKSELKDGLLRELELRDTLT
jgi:hypothetical protein